MMNRRTIAILILSFLVFVQLNGQNKEFIKENFQGKQKEFKKALKHIRSGDKLISKGNKKYQQALDYYLKVDSFNQNSALLNYKIGLCYLNTTMQKYKSIKYLEKSYKLNPSVKDDILNLLAQAYQLNYEFDKAIIKYVAYKKTIKASFNDNIIDKKIDECNYAKEMMKRPVDVIIENTGSIINSKFPDYAPIINAKETMMIFTSRRNTTTGGKMDPFDNKYFEDIYISYYDKDNNKWSIPYNPGHPINSNSHDATVGLSPDGKQLLIYKTPHKGDIYESFMDTLGKLSKPKRLPSPINSSAHESKASFSPDGNTIYFCSDREENSLGGHDIYMSKKDSKGKWGPAINLGKTINTPYDEISVFIMGDGKTMYFSSNGHNTIGGFDIFKTVNENGHWTTPVNIGYPINTPDDEVHFSITADGQHGFFASARPGGFGDLDIYRIIFFGVEKPLKNTFEKLVASTFNINGVSYTTENFKESGHIYDGATYQPIEASIFIKNAETDNFEDTLRSDPEKGQYASDLPDGINYELTIKAKNYETYFEKIPKDKSVNKTIYLTKLPTNSTTSTDGYVLDIETREPVCEAEITVTNNQDKSNKETLKSDCNSGKFHSNLPKGKSYDLKIDAKGYLPYSETIDPTQEINKLILIKGEKTKVKTLKGKVLDADNKQPVNAKIIILNEESGLLADSINSDAITGAFESMLLYKRYYFTVTAKDYIPYFETVDVMDNDDKIIYLKRENTVDLKGNVYDVVSNKTFVLPNILYDYNKYELKPQSQDSLNDLIKTMIVFPNIVIEISSHTDTRGSKEYNEVLSYNRAKSVVEYLISKGISSERLTAKGYGKNIPRVLTADMKINSCAKTYTFLKGTKITDDYINSLTGGSCETEAAHQLNRRTEFKVVRDDYKPENNKKNNPLQIEVIKDQK